MVVLMRPFGVQRGCVKIAELFVSILFAPVAQRIERRFPKPCVGGSNPLGSANLKPLENIDISVISAVFVLLFNSHLLRKCITERLFGVVLRGTPAVYA